MLLIVGVLATSWLALWLGQNQSVAAEGSSELLASAASPQDRAPSQAVAPPRAPTAEQYPPPALPVDEDQGLDEDQPAETTDRVVRRLTTRQDLDHAVAEMNRCMRGFMATCKADPLGEELRTYSEGCKPLFDLHFDPNWHDPRDNWFLVGRTMVTSSVTIWKSNRQVQKCVRLQEEALAEKS